MVSPEKVKMFLKNESENTFCKQNGLSLYSWSLNIGVRGTDPHIAKKLHKKNNPPQKKSYT